jgi:SAM-dependent methyltransferase
LLRWLAKLLGLRGKHSLPGKENDDFDWTTYNEHYRGELSSIAETNLQIVAEGDYGFRDGGLVKLRDDVKPLHPNCRLVYETILQLDVASVCEFGCGGCDHLANLKLLKPGLVCSGLDISEEQLSLARKRHPGLDATLLAHDITRPLPAELARADLAFTQAVLMHMQTGGNHRRALANVLRAAERHVVLMENWLRHDFLDDARRLHAAGEFPWDEVHFHYRECTEFRRPHLMIISSEPLPQYPELTDFGILRDAVPR